MASMFLEMTSMVWLNSSVLLNSITSVPGKIFGVCPRR